MFRRVTAFIYGVACYAVSLACFAYLAGFIENFGVPKALDSAAEGPFITALAINSALLVLFGLQHSIMARPGFKAIWTRIVPEVAERSTYLLFSCLALFVLFWKWQPMGGVIWNVESHYGRIALYSLYAIGWGIVLLCTFLINHFDLFGLRQVWLYLTGKPYTSLAVPHSWAVPGGAASVVCGMDHRVLGDADDDLGAPGVCCSYYCLHPDCDSV